jgi:hypothetical protein
LPRCLPHRFAGLLFLSALGTARPGAAQITVAGVRNLSFGFVTRGIPASVSPSDVVKSGEWSIGIPAAKLIRLTFTLPANLVGPGAATLPITFGSSDAWRKETSGLAAGIFFDPNTPVTFLILLGPALTVRLGGRVSPSVSQIAGSYQATVILTMAVLN